jgi:CheY-like chemotaxis protein
MNQINKVAVVDDDDEAAMTMIHTLEDAGFVAFRQPAFDTIQQMADAIIEGSDAAVCDHRLRYGAYADITGAQLGAELVRRQHPTILVTQYLDQYADIAIRSYRSNLPVVLRRDEADEPESLRAGFARCINEFRRGKIDDRKLHKTILKVKEIQSIGGEVVIDAIVHGWNSKDAVRFPMELVAEGDRASVCENSSLEAMTNVSTETKVDLYFEDVRLAPEPDPDDGL